MNSIYREPQAGSALPTRGTDTPELPNPGFWDVAPQSWISGLRDCRIPLPNPGFQVTDFGIQLPNPGFQDVAPQSRISGHRGFGIQFPILHFKSQRFWDPAPQSQIAGSHSPNPGFQVSGTAGSQPWISGLRDCGISPSNPGFQDPTPQSWTTAHRDFRILLSNPEFQDSTPQSWIPGLHSPILHYSSQAFQDPSPGFQVSETAGSHSPILDFRTPLPHPAFQSWYFRIPGIAGSHSPILDFRAVTPLPPTAIAEPFPSWIFPGFGTTGTRQCSPSEHSQPLPLLISNSSSPPPSHHVQEPLGCLQILLPMEGKTSQFQTATKPTESTWTPCYPLYSLLPKPFLQPSYNVPTTFLHPGVKQFSLCSVPSQPLDGSRVT